MVQIRIFERFAVGINGGAAKFLLTLATVFDEPWGVAVLEISSSLNTLLKNVPVLSEAFLK